MAYFLINIFLEDAVLIEVDDLKEFKSKLSSFGNFSDADMDRIFLEKRRTQGIYSKDDGKIYVNRLLKNEARPENLWLNICKFCKKDGIETHVKEGHICEQHILEYFNLYEYLTVESCCCGYSVGRDLLPAEKVIEVLRNYIDEDEET
jgi:hypothetical protein